MNTYKKRIADKILEKKLKGKGAVLIEGPKWCGKTTTAEKISKSILYMATPEDKSQNITLVDLNPSVLLEGDSPRLIDEWQIAPKLWDAIRFEVDHRQKEGQFILTGSSVPTNMSEVTHSGTGRFSWMLMRPMSLYESGESNGKISLEELFNNPNVLNDGCSSDLSIDELIFAACRGGWPSAVTSNKSDKAKLMVSESYFNSLCLEDMNNIDGVKRNETTTRLLLRSYARNISTLASNTTIIKDIRANTSIGECTYYDYVNTLKKLYIIDDVQAWCPAIRSKSAIQSTNKKELVDPSLVVSALGVSCDYFNLDLKTFGFIFETLCFRDLKIYSSHLKGKVSYYHDRYGLEADCVLHLKDGRYALIEFKLGSHDIDLGAKHLNEIERLIDKYNENEIQAKLRKPDLKLVITGTQYGYKRDDGVYVIPIGCLKN